jgi:hypothetical protein
MNRREFITLLGGSAAWPVTARAQQPGPIARIGVLNTGVEDAVSSREYDRNGGGRCLGGQI